jgi:colanic acid/amylovoran biosynthesis protein
MTYSRARIALFGASPNTGNQGVNALCWSALEGIAERIDAEFHVFGYGDEISASRTVPGSSPAIEYTAKGMSVGKSVWRANHLWRARCSARVRSWGNDIVRAIGESDAVLDVSGGDSFTDIYGPSRFNDIVGPKRMTLNMHRPLILLPQTYGPFTSSRSERIAKELIDASSLAYARDPQSYQRLQSLLGPRFDPARHREGVDLAFGLPPRRPAVLEPGVSRALASRDPAPLIGLNVSGMLANRDDAAARFGLASNHRQLIARIARRLLEETDAHLLLIPHVHAPQGHLESDIEASENLMNDLARSTAGRSASRVDLVTRPYDATELKWLISQTDWFCGARMHATIAALSSGVPACAMAYSIKTKGVFDTCGLGDAVVDLRSLELDEAADRVLSVWQKRHELAARLTHTVPQVVRRASEQLDQIVGTLTIAKAA